MSLYIVTPSDLEVQLRDMCQKIRVHATLSGAHMIFPQEQGLAIRIYYPNDTINQHKEDEDHEDIDGILEFCQKFQWSLVLFVVPDLSALNDMDSFVQRSMQLMDRPMPPNKPSTRFIVVSNTEQAILAIVECADAITPSRCALRSKFTDKIRIASFCPKDERNTIEGNTAIPSNAEEDYAYDVAAANQVKMALREWGHRSGIPNGETDVLLRVLPNLGQLVCAKDDALSMIPVEGRTKQKWRRFLSSHDDDPFNPNKTTIDETTVDPTMIISPPARGMATLPIGEAMHANGIPNTGAYIETGNVLPFDFRTTAHPYRNHHQFENMYVSSNNMQAHHSGDPISNAEAFVTPEQYTAMPCNQAEPQYWIPSQNVQQYIPSILSHQRFQASALPWGQPAVRSSWSSPPSGPSLYYPNDPMWSMATPGHEGGYAPQYSSQQMHWPAPVPHHMALAATTPYGARRNFYSQENDPKYMVRKFM
jgi:hypothetical protein